MSTNYDFEKTTHEHYQEIFKKKISDAQEYNLISHDENFLDYIENREDISNWLVMDSSLNAERLAEIFEFIDKVFLSSKVKVQSRDGSFINAASGSDLDDIGRLFNCPRPESTYAGVELTFNLNKTIDVDVNEPAGVQVTSKSGVVFETVEELYFPAGTTEAVAYAYSVVPGVKGNVIAGSLNKILSRFQAINVNATVVNLSASNGGRESCNDNEYRDLILNWIKVHLKGHHYAYIDYFKRADGVDGYNIIPNWDGSGTVKIVVDPGDAYTLNKIYNEINTDVTQETEAIVLMAPVLKSIDVYAVCNVDIDNINPFSSTEKQDIASKIQSAIIKYIENMKLGEDFIPHKLAVFLDKEIFELKNITFNYPTSPVTISDEEKTSPGNVEVIME